MWKCWVSKTTLNNILFYKKERKKCFQNFAHSLKKKIKIKIYWDFGISGGMKSFFITLFFFISRILYHDQQIYIYILWFFPYFLLWISLSPFNIFLVFLSFRSSSLMRLQFQENGGVLKSHTGLGSRRPLGAEFTGKVVVHSK